MKKIKDNKKQMIENKYIYIYKNKQNIPIFGPTNAFCSLAAKTNKNK